MNVQILSFFIKYNKITKLPYLKVKIKFLDEIKSHVYTFIANDFLGIYFTNKNFIEFYKKSIDK